MTKTNTFLSNLTSNDVLGDNGMPAHSTTDSAVLDLFFALGTRPDTARVIILVSKAWAENPELTLKALFHSRDVRGGKGERKSFRDALKYLANFQTFPEKLVALIPEFGRWDDLHVLFDTKLESAAIEAISNALLVDKNGLAAKWSPRKGPIAARLTKALKLSPRSYRKLLVGLTKVVETPMCANEWAGIKYSAVPSQASRIYASAFFKHDPDGYTKWKSEIANPAGETKEKINVGTLYPHEIVKKLRSDFPAEEAWAKLQETFPLNDSRILPVCDVSGSMTGLPLDVCVSLGIFLSQRNRGPFQDRFVTFSEHPKLQHLTGTLQNRVDQLQRAQWDMNTNLAAVFNLIAKAAVGADTNDVPTDILILSDMQFDACVENASDNAFAMAKRKFEAAGLKLPRVIFWNLKVAGRNTLPVKSNAQGAALISGFSPSILSGLLNSTDDFSPLKIMLDILNVQRYSSIVI